MAAETVLRVSQLDATELDDELSSLLQQQFVGVFKSLPLRFISRFKPELKLFIRWLVWKYSICESNNTFGQKMMDLHYNASKGGPMTLRHHIGLFLVLVIAEWLRDRFDVLLSFVTQAPPSSVQKTLDAITACIKTLSLVNFIIFLLYGSHPTVKERLLGLTMSPSRPQALRQLSYEYMNREILWHGFSEFIFYILPHFNLFAIRNWLRRKLRFTKDNGTADLQVENFEKCSFCEYSPTMPHVAECGHVYCYYCLRANCLADSNFACSVCSRPVHQWTPAQMYST
jgi:peroxin-2